MSCICVIEFRNCDISNMQDSIFDVVMVIDINSTNAVVPRSF